MSDLVDAIQRFKAEIIENENGVTVSNGFTTEKWDLDVVNYLSPSRMKLLGAQTGKHFEWKYVKGRKDKDTPAKILGRQLHSALLEPEDFKKRYIIEPKFSGTGMKKRKEEWHETLRPDAIILTEGNAELVVHMIEAIQANQYSKKLLSNGTPEVRAFAKDPLYKDHNGDPILWFCILDFYRSGNVIVELKSTKNGKRRKFESDCLEYGYHIQTWIGRRVVELITGQVPKVMVIDVENKAPHCVATNECPHRWFEVAQDYIHRGIKVYNDGMKTGQWHGWQRTPGFLLLPEYAELDVDEVANIRDFQ